MDITLLLQYIIIGIISYLGLFVGKMLAMIAPEEVKPGEGNLIFFQKILFLVCLVVFMIMLPYLFAKIIAGILLAFYLIKMRDCILHNNNYYLVYTCLGLFLGLSEWQIIIYPAFLIFIMGLPTASLNHNKTFSVYVKLFLVFMVFFISTVIIKYNFITY